MSSLPYILHNDAGAGTVQIEAVAAGRTPLSKSRQRKQLIFSLEVISFPQRTPSRRESLERLFFKLNQGAAYHCAGV
jgi:hypothetical protein